jgi:hypothetical protein
MQLCITWVMNSFKKNYDSVRRDLVQNILICFDIPMKLVGARGRAVG